MLQIERFCFVWLNNLIIYIFFIYPFIRQLKFSLFNRLPFINNAAMNFGVHISF